MAWREFSPEDLKHGIEIEYQKMQYTDEGSLSSGLVFYTKGERGERITLGSDYCLSEYGLSRHIGTGYWRKEPGISPEDEDRIRIQTILMLFVHMGMRIRGDGVNQNGVPSIESEEFLKELTSGMRWEVLPKEPLPKGSKD